ncbi:hypothetical protein SAY87_022934 [Trapa incisa]|uniref:Uncharacterized protein n=1 Tax=Trapa incisa TaxID=236973 RepID=A0AAN7K8K9_9MYRT|nr:hypothetical protein SAY87_022934 [Trapa incisa]
MGLTLKEYAGLEFCRGSPLGISCEIWLTWQTHREVGILKIYHWHWFLATFLSVVYLCLSYGLFVPDWQFEALSSAEATGSTLYTVKCSTRGNLGHTCNSAGMIDRHIVGINHHYMKHVYRNLKVYPCCSRDDMPTGLHGFLGKDVKLFLVPKGGETTHSQPDSTFIRLWYFHRYAH